MKKIILITMGSLTMTGCYKEDTPMNNNISSINNTRSNSGSTGTSHYCGYPTKKGTPVRGFCLAAVVIAGNINK